MSESKEQHTPTPWRIHSFYSTVTQKMDKLALRCVGKSMTGRDWTAYVEAGDGTSVLQTDGATEEEAIANAETVLRAVNSHAALVEALREILDGPARAVPSGKFQVWDRARAALALAEKES